MGAKKHPFDHVITKVASAGTNTLEHDRVSSGRLYCYQHVGVVNETSAYTRLRIKENGGGPDFLLTEQQAPAADYLYWDTEEYFISEGQRIAAELTGCTASDVLKMFVRGWWQDIKEEV